eukprot:6197618-Pleurochrysis_carterae.AAC.1
MDACTLERCLNIAARKGGGEVALACELFYDVLASGTERLASITASTRGVTEGENLAWHNERHDMRNPARQLGVELEQVKRHRVCQVEVLDGALLAVGVGVLVRRSPLLLRASHQTKKVVPHAGVLLERRLCCAAAGVIFLVVAQRQLVISLDVERAVIADSILPAIAYELGR